MEGYNMIDALKKIYEADIAHAQANIQVYLQNPAGIGEHPEIMQSIGTQLRKIAEAEHHIEVLQKHFVDQKVI